MDHNTAVYHSGKKLTKEMVIDSYVYNFKSPRHSKNPHFEKYAQGTNFDIHTLRH